MLDNTFGFRIIGPCNGDRHLIGWPAAFNAYAACDERAKVEREAYLSAFTFGDDFRALLSATFTTKGFAGPCWSLWVWFDIDREDNLEAARADAAKLVLLICQRYAIADDDVLIFFSGSKGFHIGLPTAFIAGAVPSLIFHRIARRFAERLAELAGIVIDTGVYDAVRAFRAPNSRHPKTGLHKRRITLKTLLELGAAGIMELAKTPEAFDVPTPPASGRCDFNPSADWNEAAEYVQREAEAQSQRRVAVADGTAGPTLNRLTLEFIRDGANDGDRHRLLYSSARNLAEFGCPPALAHALLTEAALDSGLSPSEVRRQIDCGLKDGAKGGAA